MRFWFHRRRRLVTWWNFGGFTVRGTGSMDITIPEGEVVTMTIAPNKRSTGRPGIFATPVSWVAAVSGDTSGIVVDVSDDALSSKIRGRIAGTLGSLTLKARRLDGAESSETHNITVTPPAADDFGASISEPMPDVA